MTIDSEKGEKLSSFVDGELSGDHCETLISSICKDEDMKSCLTRYQIISDSMKRQLPNGIKSDFVHCVMSAIESEPALSMTSTTTFSSNSSSKTSSDFDKKPASGNVIQFPSFYKKVAGFAIAASVATIAVIGVQTQNQDDPQQVVAMPKNSEFVRLKKESSMTASVNPVITPKAANGFSTASSPVSRKAIPQLQPTRKLDPILQQYIVNHSQNVSGAGVHDIISHARIVASSQKNPGTSQVQR
jgi:negative regulator of sigma E activity